jgi:hypothetical protein
MGHASRATRLNGGGSAEFLIGICIGSDADAFWRGRAHGIKIPWLWLEGTGGGELGGGMGWGFFDC